jgi:hypothetical protein
MSSRAAYVQSVLAVCLLHQIARSLGPPNYHRIEPKDGLCRSLPIAQCPPRDHISARICILLRLVLTRPGRHIYITPYPLPASHLVRHVGVKSRNACLTSRCNAALRMHNRQILYRPCQYRPILAAAARGTSPGQPCDGRLEEYFDSSLVSR